MEVKVPREGYEYPRIDEIGRFLIVTILNRL